MERKVIRIKARIGNGLTPCDYCGFLTWDSMTYDLIRCDTKKRKELPLTIIVCNQCLDEVRAYWLRRGYIVKEPSING